MTKRYTAVIKITSSRMPLERVSPQPAFSRQVEGEESKSEGTRDLQEVTTLVIRADSIEALITKATAHLQLVED